MTPEGDKLDRFLNEAITQFSSATGPSMSGISRLANAAGNLAKQADAAADDAASQLEAAFNKQLDVAAKYKAFAADVTQKANEAQNTLNQLSNLPIPDGSAQSS